MKKRTTKRKSLAFLLALSFTVSLLSAAAFAETAADAQSGSGTDSTVAALTGDTGSGTGASDDTGKTETQTSAGEGTAAADTQTAEQPEAQADPDTIDLAAQTDALTVTESGKTLTGIGTATVTLTGGTAGHPVLPSRLQRAAS